jgi:hypothetical protein
MVNELRLGFNRVHLESVPGAPLNPSDFGIHDGINQPIGLPQINVAGGLNFGNNPPIPQGRHNTTVVAADTLNLLRGPHSFKVGGEYRRSYANSFILDAATFNFPSVAAFIAGNANSFSIIQGDRSASFVQNAIDFFGQDNFKWRPNLTFELGLRYSLNLTPTERFDHFVVFDWATVSLVRVGRDIDKAYETNARNFQPRLGLAWDPFKDGKTSLRLAYALMTEEPMINAVQPTVGNPPFATPLAFAGTVRLDNAINLATAGGLAPFTIDHGYENSYVQSWNLNLQREIRSNLVAKFGYFGSKGTNLRISRNINQPVNGVRPYPRLSSSSPDSPGCSSR